MAGTDIRNVIPNPSYRASGDGVGFTSGGPIPNYDVPHFVGAGASLEVHFYDDHRREINCQTYTNLSATPVGVNGLTRTGSNFQKDAGTLSYGYVAYARGAPVYVGAYGDPEPQANGLYCRPNSTAPQIIGIGASFEWCMLSGSHGWRINNEDLEDEICQYAAIALSTSGAGTIVAAVAGRSIVVKACQLVANGTVNTNWQSHTTTSVATGLSYDIANTGYVLPEGTSGWFATVAGEALDLNLSASVAVGGQLVYALR